MLHQGVFDKALMDVLDVGWGHFNFRELEFFDRVNLLKGGIVHATLVNTVSPAYAREILQPFAYGIEGVVRVRAADLSGILNGADYGEWNPEADPMIAARYSSSDLAGKALCKRDLQRTMGLPEKPSSPLFGLVSRLVKQKGIDLLAEALPRILGLDVQFVILGAGEPWSHGFFEGLARACPDKFACRIGFEPAMAHRIIAGCDFFVMPSRFEPCGLTQMYGMRYGTLPVVHATGGLDDTVENFNEASLQGTGFKSHPSDGGGAVRHDRVGDSHVLPQREGNQDTDAAGDVKTIHLGGGSPQVRGSLPDCREKKSGSRPLTSLSRQERSMDETHSLGASYLGEGRCDFVLWAPYAERVEVRIVAPAGLI